MKPDTSTLPSPMLETLRAWSRHIRGAPTAASILLGHGAVARHARLAPDSLRGPAARCYTNSASALTHVAAVDGWRYCEGYAFVAKHGCLFEHAWLLGPDDQAWETTWQSTDGVTYLGLAFTPLDVIEMLEESEEPLLFGDWDRGFRLHAAHSRCCRAPFTRP